MSKVHVVKQGEFLLGIVKKYGFADFKPVWDHADNAELKQLRGSPNVLYPGDRLHIPDMETGVKEGCATEEKHRFRLHTSTLMLRMVLKDINDEPIANKDCVLKVEATEFPLLTDGEGLIEQSIPITARRAWLTVDDIEQSLLIGELDPVIQSSGQRSRLNNLGYRAGPIGCDCEHRLLSAIEEFQCNNDLAVDGDCGPNTQAKLIEIHGC